MLVAGAGPSPTSSLHHTASIAQPPPCSAIAHCVVIGKENILTSSTFLATVINVWFHWSHTLALRASSNDQKNKTKRFEASKMLLEWRTIQVAVAVAPVPIVDRALSQSFTLHFSLCSV
jgi:hypothetical protein